tara:strand:- start:360 stop:899 length:540 start_codon:yes stop_codon:yes gene_type:complete
MKAESQKKINIQVELLSSINNLDLADLCNITEQAIKAGGGFGWLKVPPRDILNKYWKGVMLIKNRKLIVGRLNKFIAGTLQLIFQPSNNEAQQNIFNIVSHFVAPWARGYGLAKAMIDKAEIVGIENGANCAQLDVRETQEAAIQLFISKGYTQWGINPNYAQVEGKNIKGLYYFKKLK